MKFTITRFEFTDMNAKRFWSKFFNIVCFWHCRAVRTDHELTLKAFIITNKAKDVLQQKKSDFHTKKVSDNFLPFKFGIVWQMF